VFVGRQLWVTLPFIPPHLFQKMSLMDLFWWGDRKFCDFWLNLAIFQNLFSLTF